MTTSLADYVLAPLSALILIIYHCYLFRYKSNSLRRLTNTIRTQWVRQSLRVESVQGNSTVPLNTLRNNITVVAKSQQSSILICAAIIG